MLPPPGLANVARLARELRDTVKASLPDFMARRRFWERAFRGPAATLACAASAGIPLITGRKRYQAATRAKLKPFEVLDGVLRINPPADWDADDVEAWLDENDLPRHPLVEQGYLSIGRWPCTRAVQDGEDARAGRRSGMDKVECGIHLGQRQAAA